MKTTAILSATILSLCLLLAACSSNEEQPTETSQAPPLGQEEAAAARTRGVPTTDYGKEEAPSPKVVLESLSYEWQQSPDRGLLVTMEFVTHSDSYERAKGYVFLVAEAAQYGVAPVVYPWNVRFDGDLPEDYTDGAHLLYRDSQTVRAFLPYGGGDGYFNRLRLYLFTEDGRLRTGRNYDLEITGQQGQGKSIKPGFDI